MSAILLVSIGIRIAAMLWSAELSRRIRDWRMGVLTMMLALMALRQVLTLAKSVEGDLRGELVLGDLAELPGLAVSLLAALAVISLQRMLLQRREDERELRAREAELQQARKMEALGTLAGGIAHDFNNLLTAILGHAEIVKERLEADDPSREDLRAVCEAGDQAAELTRKILTFARRQVVERRVQDLNGILFDLVPTLRRVLSENIELVAIRSERPAFVQVDKTQMDQVLMNLVANARDAMPDGGTLTLRIEEIPVEDATGGACLAGSGSSSCLRLSVADDGMGMTEDVQRQIFEPFYTTKAVGKGTGLGLSTCYGIVTDSGGKLLVESKPGAGSCFSVLLPRAEPLAEVVHSEEAKARSGTETVLLVEDEPRVRRLLALTLERNGYTVLHAENGEEALRISRSRGSRELSLVLTDLVMPQMGGRELVARLSAERPDLRFLLMSGYAQLREDGRKLDAPHAFLQKPFAMEALLAKVRELLDAEAGRSG